MDKEGQLIGAYGRDRREFLQYKSALLQAEKQSRVQAGNRKLKDLYRRSPSPHKSSELRPMAHSHSPISHRTLSHKELGKRESLPDRSVPATEDSIKDTTLSNYFWTLEDEYDSSMSFINGKAANTGAKLVAAVDENAEYYEQELRKELKFLQETDVDIDSERQHQPSLPALQPQGDTVRRVRGYMTPTYSLEPQIELPSRKHESLKKLAKHDRNSELKASILKGLPSIRESVEAEGARRMYKVKAQLAPPKLSRRHLSPEVAEDEQDRRQQKLEESIHELDELLQRLKKKHSLRSSSVLKDTKSKSVVQRRRLDRVLPRLRLPRTSAHE